jgi:cyclase
MTWSRREFVRASSLGLLAGALPLSFTRGQGTGPLQAAAQAAGQFQPLRRNVGVFTARGGTIGWLVNDGGAVVVDSQYPDTARQCLDGLDAQALPLEALVNTHHHGDHTGGNPVFRDSTRRIVAHQAVPRLQREAAARAGTELDQAYPDTTFRDGWTLQVGDETVSARHHGPAHTGGDCVVHFRNADVVHMGDLVFNRLYPFIDRPGGALVAGWIQLLERVAADHSPDTLYIFGHGQPGFGVTGGRSDLLYQRDFLSALLETATRAHATGLSRDDVVASDSLPGFPDHVPPAARLTLGAALGAAFDEVAETR